MIESGPRLWERIIEKGIKLSVYNLYYMVSIVKRQSLCFKYDVFEVITQVISTFFWKYLNTGVIDYYFQAAIVIVIKYVYEHVTVIVYKYIFMA